MAKTFNLGPIKLTQAQAISAVVVGVAIGGGLWTVLRSVTATATKSIWQQAAQQAPGQMAPAPGQSVPTDV